jgi:hypothetical protein
MNNNETTALQLLTVGGGKAIHLRDARYDHKAILCGGTRVNGRAQVLRGVYSPTAVVTCKACLKLM